MASADMPSDKANGVPARLRRRVILRFDTMNPDPKRVGVSRRSALRLALGGAAVTLLAACAPIGPANSTSSSAPQQTGAGAPAATVSQPAGAPTAAGTPKRGGVLRIGRANEPSNLDGSLISP